MPPSPLAAPVRVRRPRFGASEPILTLLLALCLLAGCGGEGAEPEPGDRKAGRSPGRSDAGSAPVSAPTAEPTMEEEVRTNVLAQPVGDGSVADLGLPGPFVDRLVDRVIRESYQDEFHGFLGTETALPPPAATARAPADAVRRVDTVVDAEAAAAWLEYGQVRPARRGFIAPVLGLEAGREPIGALEPEGLPEGGPEASVARIIAARLAPDGLLVTLGRVIEAVDPQSVLDDPALWHDRLRHAGFPVDLLAHFGRTDQDATAVMVTVARIVADEGGAEAAGWRLTEVSFRWRPTVPGFRVMTESGEGELEQLRLQLTRGSYWRGPGAGGSIDLARQLVERLPGVDLIASVERRFADDLQALALSWPMTRAHHVTLVVEPMVVSQWAQDNAKPGRVPPSMSTDDGVRHLVPRYASRREDGSVFIAGESALVDGLAAAGLQLARSPLLFQGGNLLAVRHPVSGARILLVGEAEVHRNTSLGLTSDQVASALAAEFGVDRVEVLPAVAFHIDYDLSVRAVDDRLVAFVNDPVVAARAIVMAGAAGLRDGGLLGSEIVQGIAADFAGGRADAAVRAVGGPLMQVAAVNEGRYPVSLARTLVTAPHESAVGNMRPLLCALDTLFAEQVGPPRRDFGRYATAHLRAYHRLKAARADLHARLEALGFELVFVPGLPEGARGLTYLNGVHDRTRYLMPAWGGRYASVDSMAQRAFETALGPGIEVIPIHCAESQRRSGAVHCAVSAIYAE